MTLPIQWDQNRNTWCIYDSAGKELWHAEKYADAVLFAEDYSRQQQVAAQAINHALN